MMLTRCRLVGIHGAQGSVKLCLVWQETPLGWEGKFSVNKDGGRYSRGGRFYSSPVY